MSMTRMGHLEPVATKALVAFHAYSFCKELGLHNIIYFGR
jgi:hypothetical protein